MKKVALLNCHGDDVFCFRREIIEALIEKECQVILSCPEHHRLDYFRKMQNVIIEDVNIDRRGTNPIKDVKLVWDYFQMLRRQRPDVICTFTIKPNVYGSIAADILGIPHINNITGIGSGYKNGGFVKRIVTLLYKVALRKSRMVFFQNSINLQTAQETGMIKKVARHKVIPGSGVNLEYFTFKERVSSDKIVFNYIGRVMKDKSVDDYFAAARAIRNRFPQTEFNVIGFVEKSEEHYKKVLELLEKEGIVHYFGNVEDVRPLIYSSDAIIHPSSYGEGISNVLLETAACGRACITTNVEGCRECVDDNVTGYVYQVGNVDALCERIKRFIHLSHIQRVEMGIAGRKKVEREFDRRIVVETYLQEIG